MCYGLIIGKIQIVMTKTNKPMGWPSWGRMVTYFAKLVEFSRPTLHNNFEIHGNIYGLKGFDITSEALYEYIPLRT